MKNRAVRYSTTIATGDMILWWFLTEVDMAVLNHEFHFFTLVPQQFFSKHLKTIFNADSSSDILQLRRIDTVIWLKYKRETLRHYRSGWTGKSYFAIKTVLWSWTLCEALRFLINLSEHQSAVPENVSLHYFHTTALVEIVGCSYSISGLWRLLTYTIRFCYNHHKRLWKKRSSKISYGTVKIILVLLTIAIFWTIALTSNISFCKSLRPTLSSDWFGASRKYFPFWYSSYNDSFVDPGFVFFSDILPSDVVANALASVPKNLNRLQLWYKRLHWNIPFVI